MSRFERLGREVAATVDGDVDHDRRLAQRQRLIEHASVPQPWGGWGGWVWPTLTATAVAGALALWLAGAGEVAAPEASQTTSAGALEGLQAGMYLSAPEDRALEIEVAGGGKVSLSPGGRGRVSEAAEDRVGLVLEGGAFEAEAGSGAAQWRLEAGPVSLVTSDAVFVVEWDPDRYLFRLAVREGEVRVHGGGLGDEAMVVRAGDRLRMDREGTDLRRALAVADPVEPGEPTGPSPVADAEPTFDDEGAVDEGANAGTGERERVASKKPSPTPEPVEPPAWLVEADRGQYRRALQLAETEGFSRLVRELDPESLKKLADTARLARDADRAREALTALRDRHAWAPQAKLAAFLLGRVAFDLDRDYVTAAHWFTTYEAESPRGRFVAQARGRVIDALQRSGDTKRAERAARIYLEKHADGPYAALAQSVLEDKDP